MVRTEGHAGYCRYQKTSGAALSKIYEYVHGRKINMLFATMHISVESAQLGYLLSRFINTLYSTDKHWVSFFSNSAVEAMSGAIKLARHTAKKRYPKNPAKHILIIDSRDRYRQLFNPTNDQSNRSLAPDLVFDDDFESAVVRLKSHGWAGVIFIKNRDDAVDVSALKELERECKKGKCLFILADSEGQLTADRPKGQSIQPDVVIFGENATDHQIPFGSFSMSYEVYRVWNNFADSLAHTSTYGGNGIACSFVVDSLLKTQLFSNRDIEVLNDIARDKSTRTNYFSKYINNKACSVFKMFGLDIFVKSAYKSRLLLDNDKEVLDLTGSFGCNLRGHNSDDVVEHVLNQHDPSIDYFKLLESHLAERTGFPHAFPAVSGATAVDVGVSLGMIAAAKQGRRKILTFDGNYAGKTLLAFNMSQRSPTTTGSDLNAFSPFYSDTVYLDPHDANVLEDLERELRSGEIGLVWFEIVQGSLCETLSPDILRLIQGCKEEGGYLVGVDEALTGIWRASSRFLAYWDYLECVDIVTLAKGLSDTIFPIGVCLVSSPVYRAACNSRPEFVAFVETYHRNNLGAHIALNALSRFSDSERQASLSDVQKLYSVLGEAAKKTAVFDRIQGRGNLSRFTLNKRWFPFNPRSQLGQVVEGGLSTYILEKCGVLVVAMRFHMATFSSPEDINEVEQRMLAVIEKLSPARLYFYILKKVIVGLFR